MMGTIFAGIGLGMIFTGALFVKIIRACAPTTPYRRDLEWLALAYLSLSLVGCGMILAVLGTILLTGSRS